MNRMKEKELSVCIWIHHIATFAGIAEGIYYLAAKRQGFLKSFGIFLFTLLQSWAGIKIFRDLRSGSSRLAESYENIKKLTDSKGRQKGILFGLALSTAVLKILPVHIVTVNGVNSNTHILGNR